MVLSEQGRMRLQKHPLVEGINEDELNILLKLFEEKTFAKGDIVARKGEVSDELHLLIEGAVTYNKSELYDSSHVNTYLLHAPATLGESAFLNPEVQPLDVFAYEDQTIVYILHRRHLEENSIGTQLLNRLILNLIRLDLEGARSIPLVISKKRGKENEEHHKRIPIKKLTQEMLIKWLPKDWTSRERKEIEDFIEIKHLSPQENCIRQNDPVDCFYLLIEGQLNVLEWDAVQNHPVLVELLNSGDHFGQNSILKPLISPYTIEAQQPSTILSLSRKKLEQNVQNGVVQKLLLYLAQYNPDQSPFIQKNYGEISMQKEEEVESEQAFDRLEFLRQHWMMKGLIPDEIESIHRIVQSKAFSPGAKIIHKQNTVRDLYIILQGEATLHREERGEEKGIDRVQPGDVFGEFGFLTGQTTPYSAIASTKMEILQLPFEAFKEMLSNGQGNLMKVMSNCAGLMQQRLEHWKDKEEAILQVKNQQLIRKKAFWLFSILGLILSFLEPYKSLGKFPFFILTLVQIFIPVLFIHSYLKEPLNNWGWNRNFLKISLLQVVISIALFGGIVQLISQVTDLPSLNFFSPSMWRNMAFPLSSVFGYFIFVVVQEWLRRGIVALSLQRGLENGRGWWAALLSALLFGAFAPIDAPFFAAGLFLKDFILAKLFLRAPYLLGVIIIHFVLGLFFAYLGWYTI